MFKGFLKELLQFPTLPTCDCYRICGYHWQWISFAKSDNTNLTWKPVCVEVMVAVLPHACPVLCVADNSRWHVAGSPHGLVSKNVRWRLLWWVMEKADYFCQCSLVLCFPIFKGICSLIRYRKQLATCWWEPMEENTLSINCVFLIPWWRLLGVGIDSILGTAALR